MSRTFVFLFSIALLVCSGLAASESPSGSERANLIVQKKLTPAHEFFFAQDQNFTVQLNIFNVGNGPAYSVAVSDEWPAQYFELLDGEMTKKFEEIGAGQNASFNFNLKPNFNGVFPGFRARVEYQPTMDAQNVQFGYSTQMYNTSFLSSDLFNKITSSHCCEWTVFGVGTSAAVVGPLLYWLYIQFNFQNGLPKSKSS